MNGYLVLLTVALLMAAGAGIALYTARRKRHWGRPR